MRRAQDSPETRRVAQSPFDEAHYPVAYWARLWGFSPKTIREWFRDQMGPGILRVANTNRLKKRDYTTVMISASAAARVYSARTNTGLAGQHELSSTDAHQCKN